MLDEAIGRPTERRLLRPRARARADARPPAHGRRGRLATARPSSRRSRRRCDVFEADRRRGGPRDGVAAARLVGRAPHAASATPPTRQRAIEHARRAGDVRQERRAATAYAGAALARADARRRGDRPLRGSLEQTAGDRQSEGNLLAMLAGLYAMQGAFDHARELVAERASLLSRSSASTWTSARADMEAWRVEMLAGDARGGGGELRRSYDALVARGREVPALDDRRAARRRRCWSAVRRSRRRAARRPEPGARDDGDVDYAGALALRPRPGASPGAASTPRPRRIIREALALLEPTDATLFQLEAELDLGEVLAAAGRNDEARAAYEAARELAERKGGVVILGGVIRRLEALDAAPRRRSPLPHQSHEPVRLAPWRRSSRSSSSCRA